jgi:hypothetical protein
MKHTDQSTRVASVPQELLELTGVLGIIQHRFDRPFPIISLYGENDISLLFLTSVLKYQEAPGTMPYRFAGPP